MLLQFKLRGLCINNSSCSGAFKLSDFAEGKREKKSEAIFSHRRICSTGASAKPRGYERLKDLITMFVMVEQEAPH